MMESIFSTDRCLEFYSLCTESQHPHKLFNLNTKKSVWKVSLIANNDYYIDISFLQVSLFWKYQKMAN